MKKLKNINLLAIVSLIATFFATTIATSACTFYFYQPEEPECLKEME